MNHGLPYNSVVLVPQIFDLYSSDVGSPSRATSDLPGLGFVDSKRAVMEIEMEITDDRRWSAAAAATSAMQVGVIATNVGALGLSSGSRHDKGSQLGGRAGGGALGISKTGAGELAQGSSGGGGGGGGGSDKRSSKALKAKSTRLGRPAKATAAAASVTVHASISQDLHALRNRSGDTGE